MRFAGQVKMATQRLLLEHDPTANDNWAIITASENGHTKIVKLLLKHGADLSAQNNLAIIDCKW